MNVKPGDRITFRDEYRNYEGIAYGYEYYKGIVKSTLNDHIISVIFTEMSFNGKDYHNIGRVYTTTDTKDIISIDGGL